MLELFALTALFYLLLSRRKRRPKRYRTIDAEYRALIESSADATATALEIKQFLLDIITDNKNDAEKFSDARLAEAQTLIDRAGPNGLYWLADIAAQLAFLSAAHINGFQSNVSDELGNSATPEAIVNLVAKI